VAGSCEADNELSGFMQDLVGERVIVIWRGSGQFFEGITPEFPLFRL
jgi:hypothetical protein